MIIGNSLHPLGLDFPPFLGVEKLSAQPRLFGRGAHDCVGFGTRRDDYRRGAASVDAHPGARLGDDPIDPPAVAAIVGDDLHGFDAVEGDFPRP